MTDTTDFPEMPGHPEHTTVWTESEKRVIAEYAEWCVEADRASRAHAQEAKCNGIHVRAALEELVEAYSDGEMYRYEAKIALWEAARRALSAQQEGK